MSADLHVLGISGSLRERSYNTAALRAAQNLAPPGMVIEIAHLRGLPMYNADDEARNGFPPPVAELRARVAQSDALLLASPEYNFSVTGALKNALDWISRPPDAPLTNKPAAILGAGGRFGTLRAQLHLREMLLHNNVRIVTRPQVLIEAAHSKFDSDLTLVDERAIDQIGRLLVELVRLVE